MTDRVTPTLPSRDLAATSAIHARLGFREVFRDVVTTWPACPRHA